ncbi:small ribosomal subunit protein uS12m [Anolis carolinensis]|nr:PREDICTED: 28S ribosomal protein S12, mitochondrial [Anolis carolinensis]|eukprot:XP_003229448.1 PREDICTED: 28S ribosomal protein S12, mitochondrial [Anolis carolinensis]
MCSQQEHAHKLHSMPHPLRFSFAQSPSFRPIGIRGSRAAAGSTNGKRQSRVCGFRLSCRGQDGGAALRAPALWRRKRAPLRMTSMGLLRALLARPPPLPWGALASLSPRSFLLPLRLTPQMPLLLPPACPMATLNQMHRLGPRKRPPPKVGPLGGHPQLKGVVLKTMIRKPKKPNSANRKCARVRLSNGKEVVVFIPGEGHNLQEHNIVLVEGGRTQDLPGVKLKVVRGKYDCAHVQKKKQ